ncbi:MAG: hypothetical protein ACXW04_01835 [Methylobacter sp.]
MQWVLALLLRTFGFIVAQYATAIERPIRSMYIERILTDLKKPEQIHTGQGWSWM